MDNNEFKDPAYVGMHGEDDRETPEAVQKLFEDEEISSKITRGAGANANAAELEVKEKRRKAKIKTAAFIGGFCLTVLAALWTRGSGDAEDGIKAMGPVPNLHEKEEMYKKGYAEKEDGSGIFNLVKEKDKYSYSFDEFPDDNQGEEALGEEE